MTQIEIDEARLWGSLQTLARIGAYTDPHSGLSGVRRVALGDADAEARREVCRWFEAAGLAVRVDRIGNVFARRAGRDPGAAVVMSGSHIDSVPTGGAFDGALGVLAALECVRTLNDRAITTRRGIEVCFFTEEEGARFGTDMLGSAVAAGRIPLTEALALSDAEGRTVAAELNRIGFCGDHEPTAIAPHAYVELHIEQGPILDPTIEELGVVTGVQGISWHEVTIRGRSAHAGTTPMSRRKDALLVAATSIVDLDGRVRAGEFGPDARVTMGRLEPLPNRVNVVAGSAIATFDLRHPASSGLAALEAALDTMLAEIRTRGFEVVRRQTARTEPVEFAPAVRATIERQIEQAGYAFRPILSGAGHDAQELAALCPAGMIFVAGQYDGISHNPREFSSSTVCARGANVLLRTLLDLAEAA